MLGNQGFYREWDGEMAEVYWDGLYPNRFIVENKKEKCTWVYPMRFSWEF